MSVATTSAPGDRRDGVGLTSSADPPVPAAISWARARIVRVGREALRAGDPDVHAGGGPGEQVGVRHVAGRVAEEGQRLAGELAAVLA